MTTITIYKEKKVLDVVAEIQEGPSQDYIALMFFHGDEWNPKKLSKRPHFKLLSTRDNAILREIFAGKRAVPSDEHKYFILYISLLRKLPYNEAEQWDMVGGLEMSVFIRHQYGTERRLIAWYNPQNRRGWLFRVKEEE